MVYVAYWPSNTFFLYRALFGFFNTIQYQLKTKMFWQNCQLIPIFPFLPAQVIISNFAPIPVALHFTLHICIYCHHAFFFPLLTRYSYLQGLRLWASFHPFDADNPLWHWSPPQELESLISLQNILWVERCFNIIAEVLVLICASAKFNLNLKEIVFFPDILPFARKLCNLSIRSAFLSFLLATSIIPSTDFLTIRGTPNASKTWEKGLFLLSDADKENTRIFTIAEKQPPVEVAIAFSEMTTKSSK